MKIFASKQPYFLFYILFVIIISLMMSMYTFPEALDIGRYYEKAKNYSQIYTLSQYFNFLVTSTFDFVYTTSLFIAAKIGLHLNFVTIFYLSLYYISLCEVIRLKEPTEVHGLVLLLILLSVPFVWIQEISRNAAAIAFFYLAILQFIKDRKFLGFLFCIISIFTHISMIGWILIALLALALRYLKINKNTITIIFLSLIIIAFLIPSYLVDLISIIANSGDSRYVAYANMGSQSALLVPTIGYGDKIPIVFIGLLSIYIVLVNKKTDFFFWMLLLLTSVLIFAIMSNLMLTNRVMMLLPLFLGCNICAIIRNNNQRLNLQIYILAILGLGCNFLHFFAHREDLFS